MSDVWVSGAHGLLGSALCEKGYSGFSHAALDITDEKKLWATLSQGRPRVLINAAAQAKVDLADREPERSFAVNAHAVLSLAKICETLGIRLVHISTDYVLDYPALPVLSEGLPANPRSTYARSKWQGEVGALKHRAVVLRVQWLYGCDKRSFFAKALRRLYRKKPLVLVRDQVGSPTPVALAVEAIGHALSGPAGLYHLACRGAVSAEGWIAEAAAALGIDAVYETTTRAAISPVYRPARSCLGHTLFTQTFGYRPPMWRDAMVACLQDAGRAWLELD